jgi:hypothetical protein
MELEIIAIYCWIELILNQLAIKDDQRAEVITTAIIAAKFFSGNFEKARIFLKEHGYIPKMLSNASC